MSEWREVKLGEICDVKGGKRLPKGVTLQRTPNTHPYIRIRDLGNKRILELDSNFEYVDNDTQKLISRYTVNEGDVLLSIVGTIGLVGIVGKSLNMANQTENCAKLINLKNIDKYYLFYYLLSDIGQYEIFKGTVGAVQPKLPLKNIQSIKVKLPPIEEQNKIADVLSALDDKIELLQKENETLEALAETIFREKFVENARKDLVTVHLKDYVECVNGVSYTSNNLKQSNVAMVTLKNFGRDKKFRIDGFKEYIGKYKENQLVEEGDLLVSHTDITQDAAIVGNPVLVVSLPKYEKMIFSMDLVKVIPKGCLSKEILYLLMRSSDFKEHCLGYSNGSTVLHMSKKAIPDYEFVLPDLNVLEDIQTSIKPLYDKLFFNIKEVISLTKTRDTLLPKLINQEIEI